MRYFSTICGETYSLGEPRWRCDCGGPPELSDDAVVVLSGTGLMSGSLLAHLRNTSWRPVND